ncbi:MAG: type II toxin-antitoxin system PemK/MazF family toxin [Lachnospiraceae bacterium]|jgi:hypothetical protein|nr:type II toxin-antitoxin system PemK/MazF family toxin [Lachnospiraceae bacterium]
MNKGEIYIAFVGFINSKDGKRRPVLYVRQNKELYYVYRITTKFENKSEFIQSKYVKIDDWDFAGLKKPSWVDTLKIYKLSKKQVKLKNIGQLSKSDMIKLAKFL